MRRNKYMEKTITSILVAAVVTLAPLVPVKAQTAKRITFTNGRTTATVKGNTGRNGTEYTLRARSGQKLVLTLKPAAGVGIKVETVGSYGHMVLLEEEKGGVYEVGIEETGDLTIFIGATTGRPADFTLTVKIAKLADI